MNQWRRKDCPEPELLDAWVTGNATSEEATVIEPHLQRCTACQREAEEARQWDNRLRSELTFVDPPVDLTASVMNRLRSRTVDTWRLLATMLVGYGLFITAWQTGLFSRWGWAMPIEVPITNGMRGLQGMLSDFFLLIEVSVMWSGWVMQQSSSLMAALLLLAGGWLWIAGICWHRWLWTKE